MHIKLCALWTCVIPAVFINMAFTTLSTAATVAIVGHGASPQQLQDARVENGFDYVNTDSGADDETLTGQGKNSVQLLLNGSSSTRVLPLKVAGPNQGWSVARGEQAMANVLSRNDIKVIDFDGRQPISVGTLQQAANQNIVIVTQTGDGGLSAPSGQARLIPSLGGNGIIVGGVDAGGTILPSSNRAGDLQNHSIVANGTVANADSSSAYAKSRVASAAARVRDAAPHLSAAQTVEILKKSATDRGAPGVDHIYGHGELNVQRALDPSGLTSVAGPTSEASSGSGSGGTAIAALAVAGAIGYALNKRSTGLKKTLVLDQYKRAYEIDLSQRATLTDLYSTNALLSSAPSDSATAWLTTDYSQQWLSAEKIPAPQHWLSNDNEHDIDSLQYSFAQQSASGSSQRISLNTPVQLQLGAQPLNELSSLKSVALFASPYLGFSEQSMSVVNSLTSNVGHYSFGLNRSNTEGRHGSESSALIVEKVRRLGRGSLGVQVAYTHENNALFGSASGGALSVDSSETVSLSLTGYLPLSENISAYAHTAYGFTDVSAASDSVLKSFSQLHSNSTALGLNWNKPFATKGQLSFAVSQPLKVVRGSIEVVTPTALAADRSAEYSEETVDLSGTGTPETRYELAFTRPINASESLSLTTRLLYRDGTYADDQSVKGVFLGAQWQQ